MVRPGFFRADACRESRDPEAGAARGASRRRFADFISHLPADSRTPYWDEIEIPYQPYYAYEEVLATFGNPSPSVGSVLYAMERLAARLTDRTTIAWQLPPESERVRVLAGYGWVQAQPPAPVAQPVATVTVSPFAERSREPSVAREDRQYWCYISYAPGNDDKFLAQFMRVRSRNQTVYGNGRSENLLRRAAR